DDRWAAVERVHHVELPPPEIPAALPHRPRVETGARPAPQHAGRLDDLDAGFFTAGDAPLPGRRGRDYGDRVTSLRHVTPQVVTSQERAFPGYIVIEHQDAHNHSREPFDPQVPVAGLSGS